MQFREHVPLAPLTTLRIGGDAARFVEVDNDDDLRGVVARAGAANEPVFLLGGGSNVVIGDQGFTGLVIAVRSRGVSVQRTDDGAVLDVAAGEIWDDFVARVVDEAWAGVECLAGIPGTVGAVP